MLEELAGKNSGNIIYWMVILMNEHHFSMRISLSEGINTFGSMLSKLLFVYYLSSVTNSVILVGYLSILLIAPAILFGPFIGSFIDKVKNLKKAGIIINLLSSVLLLFLSIFIFYFQNESWLTILILIIAFINALLSEAYDPTVLKLIRNTIRPENYGDVLSKVTSFSTMGAIIASLISGLLMSKHTIWIGFALDGISFIGANILLLQITNVPQTIREEIDNHTGNKFKSFLSDFQKPIVTLIFITSFSYNFILAPFQVYSSSLAHLLSNARLIGLFQISYTLGILSASTLYSKLSKKWADKWFFITAITIVPLVFLIWSISKYELITLLAFFILGIAIPFYNITSKSLFMRTIDESRYATFMATYSSILGMVQPLSLLILPALITTFNFKRVALFVALAYAVIAFAGNKVFRMVKE